MAKGSLRRQRLNLSNRQISPVSPEGELPLRIENRAGLFGLIYYLVSAAICFAAAVMISATDAVMPPGTYETLWRLAPLLIALLGVSMLARGALSYLRRGETVITRDEVRVTEPGIFTRRSWSAPLDTFQGVRWKKTVLPRSGDSSGHKSYMHVIDLAHPDSQVFVPLTIWTTSGEGPRKKWEDLARLLGLPAIDAREAEHRIRAAEDVDKSVRDLAREGKIETQWDNRPPPDRIKVEHIGDATDPGGQQIRLIMDERPFSPMIAYPVAAVFGLSAIFVFYQGRVLFAAFILLLVFVLLKVTRDAGNRMAHLTLTRQELTYQGLTSLDPVTVPLDAIEAVKTGKGVVLVETDTGDQKIAGNLPDEAITYVRDLVESALATS